MSRCNLCGSYSAVVLAVACGMPLWQASVAEATVIGNPNAGNGWSTTSAVSLSDYSGEMDPSSPDRLALNLINGSGISGDNGELHGNVYGTWATFTKYPNRSGTFGVVGQYGTANPGTVQGAGSHWVEFMFDQIYTLDDVTIWNNNEATYYTQGWKNLVVQVSETGGENASDWTTIYDGQIPVSPGAGGSSTLPSLIVNAGGVSAKYVTLVNTGLGDEATWMTGDDGAFAALSEVRFNSGLVVPEPGALTLSVTAAIGLLAYAWRKRR